VRLFSYLLFYYSITGWVNTREQFRKCLLWLFISTIAVCALAFHQIASVSLTDWFNWLYWNQMDVAPPWQGRPTSVFLGVNSLAAHLNMIIPFALAVQLAPEVKYELRFTAKLCLLLSLIVLVLTLSRGAFLAFAITIVIYLQTILKESRVRWKWVAGIAITLLVGVLISYAALATLPTSEGVSTSERFSGGDDVTYTRLLIYAAAWEMFSSAPGFGIGYGNFRGQFDATAEFGSDLTWDAHSLYFKYLAEIGLVGTLCFLALVWYAVRMGRRSWRTGFTRLERVLGIAVIASITTVMIQGAVESLIENPPFGTMLWFIFALGVCCSRGNRTTSSTKAAGV
jgi:O-antigen ligase